MDAAMGAQRRRGAALEDALLEAAWAEIQAHGYTDFTVDAVATRAGTSKAVLYRRWPGKAELARSAIAHTITQNPITTPDTGSLREDVLAYLRQANERRVSVAAQLMAHLGEFYEATGTSIADLRDTVTTGHDTVMAEIVDRAIERGEVDADRLTDRVVRLPADLFRLELLMTRRPLAEDDITEIVDDVFLPLMRG